MENLLKLQGLINQENYDEALLICQSLIEDNPNNIDFYLYLGLIYFLNGNEEAAQEIWMSVVLNADVVDITDRIQQLGQLLVANGETLLIKNDLSATKKLLDIIISLDSDVDYSNINQKYQNAINELIETAIRQSIVKSYESAETIYLKIIEIDDQQLFVWHNLGIVYYELKDYSKAYNAIIQSLSIDDTIGEHYYSLGLILEKQNKFIEALNIYKKAIALNPGLHDAYSNLGLIYEKWGQLPHAEKIYQKGIENIPNHHGNYINLANILFSLKQYNEAIELYQKALQIKPKDADILYNLALIYEAKDDKVEANLNYAYAYLRRNNYDKAIEYYQLYLRSNIGTIDLYLALAGCYKTKGLFEDVIRVREEAINHYPNEAILYRSLIFDYQEYGYLDRAFHLAEDSFKRFPHELIFEYCSLKLLPIIYEKAEDVQYHRQKFIQYLEKISLEANEKKEAFYSNALSLISYDTNFYLNFQNQDDTKILCRYGDIVNRIMSYHYPQYQLSYFPHKITPSEKIKIAYISSKINGIGSLHLGWLKCANRDRFEIYVYNIGFSQGYYSHNYQIYSDYFVNLSLDLVEIADQILEDQPDILVFLDVGMDPTMTKLAGLRLAPVQCTTWGHPVTSGIPTIDYFLTSQAMEPPDAEKHYREQIIRLPNLGVCYETPIIPNSIQERSYFGLSDNNILYLCCQSHWKYLPQYDYIFPLIAQKIPDAKFIFFESNISKEITALFQKRIAMSFQKLGLNLDDWCVFLPRLRHNEYLKIHCLSDIFLDTIGWSGGFTTLDAIACALPVVTVQGNFLRERQSTGMLNIIEVTETIANNEMDFLEIALRLGLDSVWRQSVKEKLKTNNHRLFDDTSCIPALEAFYESAIAKFQQNNNCPPTIIDRENR